MKWNNNATTILDWERGQWFDKGQRFPKNGASMVVKRTIVHFVLMHLI